MPARWLNDCIYSGAWLTYTYIPTRTQRSNVCACGNIVVVRWRAFRLSEPSCLTRGTNNYASQSVTVFQKRITFLINLKSEWEINMQRDTCDQINSSLLLLPLKDFYKRSFFPPPPIFCTIAAVSSVFLGIFFFFLGGGGLARGQPKFISLCILEV